MPSEHPTPESASPRFDFPCLGFGLGLRAPHYEYILEHLPSVDWFEVISENYMDTLGRPRHYLNRILEHYPVVMHGVSLGIAGTDPLDLDYLKRLKLLRDTIKAPWVSDHLCWVGVAGVNTHQLLPNPYNEEALKHTISRVKQVQEFMEAPLILENPSSYLEFTNSTMFEADFLRELAEEADCGLLLDVNNVYVSSFNHDFDPYDYLNRVPASRVVQYHLAGYTDKQDHLLDTHSDHVFDEVWKLFAHAWQLTGPRAVMVEWDEDIPDFPTLHAEVLKAKHLTSTLAPEAV